MARKLNPIQRRTQRNRTRVKKNAGEGRLRLSVFRSSKNISAQLIDDVKGVTVAAASSLEEAVKAKGSNKGVLDQRPRLLRRRRKRPAWRRPRTATSSSRARALARPPLCGFFL